MDKQRIVIVDSEDREISSKNRLDINSEDIYRVSALWITNCKGEILLAQRSFSKKSNPGKWGPGVAGTVEVGESYDDNIYKEAEEELSISDLIFTKLQKVYNSESLDRKYFCQWYHVVIDRPAEFFVKQDEEVEEIRWFSYRELLQELTENPDKFLPSLPKYVEMFKDLR